MATAIRRPVSHEDRLSLTEHLDELRSRLVISVLILLGCFAFTFWQNETILKLVNEPLQQTQNLDGDKRSNDPLEQNARFQRQTAQAFRAEARSFQQQQRLYTELALTAAGAAERRAYQSAARAAGAAAQVTARAAAAEPRNKGRLPVTLGVAEPFTTTVSVAFYGALLLAFPFLLYQAYAFILPAFAPGERKIALPLMESLNSRMPEPSERPRPGSRLGPKMTSRMTRTMASSGRPIPGTVCAPRKWSGAA
jgi:sec-independent protein translocase protein TatC